MTPTQARAVLQRVLPGRITFTPEAGGYYFEAPTTFHRLLYGIAVDLAVFTNAYGEIAPRPD